MTDIMLEAMDPDIALLNAGTLRSDAVHPAGSFRLRDLMAILPMIDLITVLKISGKILHIRLTFIKKALIGCHVQCGLQGCKNNASSVSWLEVMKGVPNHSVACFVS